MFVKDILKDKGNQVHVIKPEALLSDAAGMLVTHRIGALVVLNELGGIVGVVSERDIVRGTATQKDRLWNVRVAELMSQNVRTCRPDDAIEDLMQVMTDERIRHLPVVDDDDRLIGLVSIGDVVKSRISACDFENSQLKQYIVGDDLLAATSREKH